MIKNNIESGLTGIYCIYNKISNKRYVGQATDIKERWSKHLWFFHHNSHPNDHLQKSWNKYGEDNFEFSILELCSFEQLDEREKYWMDIYQVRNHAFGYNNKEGGQHGGSVYNDESCKKMSNSHKKLLENPIEREKLRQFAKQAWTNEEYRKSRSGENHPLYGKHLSDEWKEKISKGNKGKKKPPKTEKQLEASRTSRLGKEPTNKNKTPVKCIDNGVVYKDAITAGRELGIKSPNHVISVCNKQRQSCGGYHFEFYYGDNNS